MWDHPTGGKPERVAMLSLGVTMTEWITDRLHKGKLEGSFGAYQYFDEVWTLNRGIKIFQHDFAFVLDDLQNEALTDRDYANYLRTHNRPFLVHSVYEGFSPNQKRYPYVEVLDMVGRENFYFHNSIPLIIAYCLFIGVKELVLFGCDYTHPKQTAGEDNRANCEYWVGYARAKGMRVGYPADSTLCNARLGAQLYGHPFMPPDVWEWLRA